LPLVPMHEKCPVTPKLHAGDLGEPDAGKVSSEKPNPFAVLAQLKNKK